MANGAQWQKPDANRFIVECLHKRRKLLTQAPSESEERNHITDLLEELLVEIFCRLPSSKYVIQCKCICKRWAALISSSHFISRFIASKENDERSLAIVVLQHKPSRLRSVEKSQEMPKAWMMHLRTPASDFHNICISPLPCFVDGDKTDLKVIGACNDLLLYHRDTCKDKFDYYIRNVQTMQWLQLPSLFYHGVHFIGFICDPCYSYEGENPNRKFILNAAHRYSIIVIPYRPKDMSKFKAHLLSSNTGQWTKVVLSLPRKVRLLVRSCNGNAGSVFAGMLHFCCTQGIFSFDPYSRDRIIQCHLIPRPPGFPFVNACVGVRQGHLQLSGIGADEKLQMWVLKDYMTGEWSLQQKIAINDFTVLDSCLARHIERNQRSCLFDYIIAQHPIDPDLFYVLGPRWIVLCNTQKRTIEVATPISATSCFRGVYPFFKEFQLILPIWPTPLPTLSSDV